MKTITNLLSAGLLIIISISAFAQGDGQLWKRVLGTNNIYKNPLEGNVGIGVENATEKVDIQGNLKVRGQLFADSMHINGTVVFSNNGESFIWQPNKPFPAHDNVNVSPAGLR